MLEIIGLSLLIPVLLFLFEVENSISNTYLSNISNLLLENLSINFILILILTIFFIKSLLLIFLTNFKIAFINSISLLISKKLLNNYLYQNQEVYFSKNSAEFIRNVTNENRRLSKLLIASADLFIDLTLLIVVIFFLLFLNFSTTLIILSSLVIFTLIYFVAINKFLVQLGKKNIFLVGEATRFLIESFKGFTEIFINRKQQFFINRFIFKDKGILKIKRLESVLKVLPRTFLELTFVIIVLFFIFKFSNSNYNLNNIFFLISIYGATFLKIYPSIGKSLGNFQSIITCKPSLELLKDEINFPKKPYGTSLKLKKIDYVKNIQFSNLNFNYGEDKKIITNFSNTINKNSIVGVSGASGTGKTTLINLIAGVLKPKSGRILCNDIDINEIENWLDKISYVSQKPFIIDGTIKENICLGDEDTNENEAYFEKIYNQSGLTEFIESLPKKDKTNVGDSGNLISGGQIQRIGIARALFKKSEVILLDEITSNLDTDTQNKIIKNLSLIKKDRIIFLVSHNKNNFQYCDKIINL